MPETTTTDGSDRIRALQQRLPPDRLFAERDWRLSPEPFPLSARLVKELESLGRVLLQFYRAANLLYRRSAEGREPGWVAGWLDRGKPDSLLAIQRHPGLKNEVPRVIRPDLLLTDEGFSITELDSVPGGLGLTAALNRAYAGLPDSNWRVIGGERGMLDGFASIFAGANQVHLMVSEESATYRPEMEWLAAELGPDRFHTRDAGFTGFARGDAVYRFFELFDLANVPAAEALFAAATAGDIRLTPPPKPVLEEKMLLALLWNHNLRDYWRRELGEAFFQRLRRHVPYSWVVDPAPLPPQGAIPGLNLTSWEQLKSLSQRDRNLILKVSGFSEQAWGARGVRYGSDLPVADWSAAVEHAIQSFPTSPHVLQRYHKPKVVESRWFDLATNELRPMAGRVRLCPYYFVSGENDRLRATLGGVLATICPADKKIIHGMRDAILAPCAVAAEADLGTGA